MYEVMEPILWFFWRAIPEIPLPEMLRALAAMFVG